MDTSDTLGNNPGKMYYYWVAGTKYSDIGPLATAGAEAFTKLKRITEVFAGKGQSTEGIGVAWSISPLSTGYNVYFDTLGGSGYTLLAKVGVEAKDCYYNFYLSEFSSFFSEGNKYVFRVQPVNEYCTADISDTSIALDTGYLKLSAVNSFYFYYDSVRYDTIKLNWTVKNTENLYYYIYRSVTQDGAKTLLDSVGVDTGFYFDKDVSILERGKPYWYYINTAINGLDSAESDTVEVVTYNLAMNIGISSGAWSLLGEPTGLISSGEFNYTNKDNVSATSFSDSIVIKWNKVTNAEQYYLVGDTARDFEYVNALYKIPITSGDTAYKLEVPELSLSNLGELLYFKVASLNNLDDNDVRKARFTQIVKRVCFAFDT